VMEERSSDSRLTDSRLDSRLAATNSRLDSRLASEIDSKPKLTFTDSKPDPTQVNNVSKLDSNPGLSGSEPARSQSTRGNAKRRKSAGKENQLYNRIMGLTSKNFGQLQKVYNPPVNAYMGIPG